MNAGSLSRGHAAYSERVQRFRLDDVLAEVFGGAGGDLNACVLCCDRHCGSGRIALRWVTASGELKTYTFEDLRRMSIRGAHMLTRAGVGKGDVVAGLLPRIPELVAVILATWRIGAVYQPLFTAFGPKAIEHRFGTAGTRFVATNAANRGKLVDIPNCPTVATLVGPGGGLAAGDIDLGAELSEGPESFPECALAVIPANAGIHFAFEVQTAEPGSRWIPAFAGMTARRVQAVPATPFLVLAASKTLFRKAPATTMPRPFRHPSIITITCNIPSQTASPAVRTVSSMDRPRSCRPRISRESTCPSIPRKSLKTTSVVPPTPVRRKSRSP